MKDTNEKDIEFQYQEQIFSILANVISDIFVLLTPQKNEPDYVSPNVERVLGIPRQEAKKDFAILESEEYDLKGLSWSMLNDIPVNGKKTFDVKRVHRKTGETLWFHDTAYHINVWDEDKYVIMLSDRTAERKSHEELVTELDVTRTANDAKSAFLSNMSHDIRTPMNAIVGLTSLLEQDAGNSELALDYVHRISASGQQMLDLLDDVLDMSKIESGKTELTMTEINLAELVDDVFAFLRPQLRGKHQKFEIITENLEHETIIGDRVRLSQILINILSNAIKYTQSGGRIKLRIEESGHEKENYGQYRFTVTDNGIGMSEEFQKIIFEPFTREDSVFIQSIQGAGLGMSITKNLVDLMGGTVSVQSRPGMGSSFFVDLGFEPAKEEADSDFWKACGIAGMLAVGGEEIREKLKKGMADTEVEFSEADSGDHAVELITKAHDEGNDFDLIILERDILSEETEEEEDLIVKIRQIIPPAALIIVSNAFDRTEEPMKKAGVNGVLSKPFFMTNFRKKIDRVLNDDSAVEEKKKESVLKGRHILIVEDNDLNADILAELLELRGATFQIAENGQEALRCFENAKPKEFDAIFMDIQMPVMDGYEATKAIRICRNPEGKDIPIIAMTAKAFKEDIDNSLNAGMDAYVAKPIDMKMLELTLREVWEL